MMDAIEVEPELQSAMLRRGFLALLPYVLSAQLPSAQPPSGPLHAYFIDVEGGQSTLIVSPGKHALLIDAGWNSDGRDAARIARTASIAGIEKLDALLITHFHRDHVGGVPDLLRGMRTDLVVDHGSDITPYPGSQEIMNAYESAILGIPHKIALPGDRFSIGEMQVFVVAAGGRRLRSPLSGASLSNSACRDASEQVQEHSENVQSVAVLIQFGDFRLFDGGDLLWNGEQALVCPQNLLGHVDAMLLSHHGEDTATPPTLIRALKPRAAIMNNGEKKGGSPTTAATLAAANVDLWQLHYANSMNSHNAPERFIANPQGTCNAYSIELAADRNGDFTVINSRTGYRKQYARQTAASR